ncbi:trans-sulfuration enzyme family protein [Larkinella humicola]|uniref:Aminotransferase class V-fold PLP-dependent enzyme n=1 Tax=Larkinella humicola TaxID=2607654 RepID=A0A5N1J8H4_9BACT|nr:aminotransferase class V-fold PLP-dependent enzyme [Larkinella humicola]KAA9347775.1 aminotransferase class V-fold PLP-dependent enzyme [Larkinella humicola]
MHPETLAIYQSRMADANAGAVVPPISLSTTFEREADGSFPHGHIYSRSSNPNRDLLETALAQLEGGFAGLAFSSGQAATMTLLLALRPGDHVILGDDAYHGTPALLEELFHPWGLTYTRVDFTDLEAIRSSIHENTSLIWIETPSNPLLKIADIQAIADLAHNAGAWCACDNTWATPILQRPLDLGCDVVMHSTTKYIGGHSDVLSGALIFREDGDFYQRVRRYQTLGGAVAAPFDCWMLLRGTKTLTTRVKAQSATAMQLAQFLHEHPAVEAVHYPGLESHPGHAIAQKQMTRFGAMLSVQIKGGSDAAMAVAGRVQLFTRATSLGGIESLIEHRASVEGPNTTTPQNLLRISVGLEHADDLITDLEQALNALT